MRSGFKEVKLICSKLLEILGLAPGINNIHQIVFCVLGRSSTWCRCSAEFLQADLGICLESCFLGSNLARDVTSVQAV